MSNNITEAIDKITNDLGMEVASDNATQAIDYLALALGGDGATFSASDNAVEAITKAGEKLVAALGAAESETDPEPGTGTDPEPGTGN